MPLALDQSKSEVSLDTRNLFAIWCGLLLHQTWADLVLCSLMRAWKSTAKFIWTCCRKKFFFGSQKLLRTNKSSYGTMLQLTLWSLSLWLTVRRCWTESGGFRDKQVWTPSSPDINPLDFAIWSILEREVSTRYRPLSNSLKAVILSAWTKLDEKVVWRSCASLRARLKRNIKEKGSHFEI